MILGCCCKTLIIRNNIIVKKSGTLFFGQFLGSVWVPWGHGWVTHPQGLRMGWADAEKLVCMQILRMYNWILTKLSS